MLETFLGFCSEIFNHIYSFIRSLSIMQNIFRLFMKASHHSHSHSLPKVENIEKVSQRVYRVLGQNPGYHTLQGTNIYLITGTKTHEHVLIDTGEAVTANKFVNLLFNEVFTAAKTKRISKIILSHGHADHQGGVLRILQELKERKMLPLPTIYKRKMPNNDDKYPCEGFSCEHIEDDQIFQIDEETTLKAVYTPGHTDDHVAFILEEDRALLSGDCILGCGTTVFDDLYDYMQSLHKLVEIVKRPLLASPTMERSPFHYAPAHVEKIYPGHGPVITQNALGKIEEYIHHRLTREQQIQDALTGLNHRWISSFSLVPMVYGKLPVGVYLSAQSNLRHHLQKLQREGKVSYKWPDLWKEHEPHHHDKKHPHKQHHHKQH